MSVCYLFYFLKRQVFSEKNTMGCALALEDKTGSYISLRLKLHYHKANGSEALMGYFFDHY
jgi:hypothetical protein